MQPGEAQILCVFVATLKYLDKPNLLNFRQNNEHIWGVVRDKKEYRGGQLSSWLQLRTNTRWDTSVTAAYVCLCVSDDDGSVWL